MTSSTLDPPAEQPLDPGKGRDTNALGPSDSSDSGSDVQGEKRHPFDVDSPLDAHALETGRATRRSDTDRAGTGERASADGDANLDIDADVLPDTSRVETEDVDDGEPADTADHDRLRRRATRPAANEAGGSRRRG